MTTVIFGIGNVLKGDDGVGPYIIAETRNLKPETRNIQLIDGGTVPENYIQKIIDSRPDKIIIIDAIDFGGKPGDIKWFTEINSANISISTHNLPPEVFIDFIKQQTNAEIKIIAIQPKELKLNAPMSEEVKNSADYLVKKGIYG